MANMVLRVAAGGLQWRQDGLTLANRIIRSATRGALADDLGRVHRASITARDLVAVGRCSVAESTR